MFQYLGQFVGLNFFPAELGVSHADELLLIFKLGILPMEPVFTAEDKATSKNMLKLWTDFAKTGNPTPDPSSTQWIRHEPNLLALKPNLKILMREYTLYKPKFTMSPIKSKTLRLLNFTVRIKD